MPLAGFLGPIGTSELLIILVIALIFFGGRLPDVARSLGRSFNQFKKGLGDVDDDMRKSMDDPPRTNHYSPPSASSSPSASQQQPRIDATVSSPPEKARQG